MIISRDINGVLSIISSSITFGLKREHLIWFDNIFVLKSELFTNNLQEIFGRMIKNNIILDKIIYDRMTQYLMHNIRIPIEIQFLAVKNTEILLDHCDLDILFVYN